MLEYYLCATDEEGNQILGHKMTEDMMVRWANQITALTWSNMSVVEGQGEGEGKGRMTCWCFRFFVGGGVSVFQGAVCGEDVGDDASDALGEGQGEGLSVFF